MDIFNINRQAETTIKIPTFFTELGLRRNVTILKREENCIADSARIFIEISQICR
jgi:hypothetical protein